MPTTSTGKVSNTSPTAGSTSSDLNGRALTMRRPRKRKNDRFRGEEIFGAEEDIDFRDNRVHIGLRVQTRCWSSRTRHGVLHGPLSLSSTGSYKTPDLDWDGAKMRGIRPSFTFLRRGYRRGCSRFARRGDAGVQVDLVQDCGRPLSPLVDFGQSKAASSRAGMAHSRGTVVVGQGPASSGRTQYSQIPGSRDIPDVYNVHILENAPARAATVFASKGIREPPFIRDRDLDRLQGCYRQRRRSPRAGDGRYPGNPRACLSRHAERSLHRA